MPTPLHDSWTQIQVPQTAQASQVAAGYPMGCEITALMYALKFGPSDWKNAYQALPGDGDIPKIQLLVSKFSAMPSQSSSGQPAFSEKYGTNPNDLPWMIQSLVPSQKLMTSNNYFLPGQAVSAQNDSLLQKFQSDLSENLASGQPVLMQLYFSNPDFAHAVLIAGVRNSIEVDETLKILILDPMTGKESEATIQEELVTLGGNNLNGLSFLDPDVINKKAVIISALMK